jgi:hypothetical protein
MLNLISTNLNIDASASSHNCAMHQPILIFLRSSHYSDNYYHTRCIGQYLGQHDLHIMFSGDVCIKQGHLLPYHGFSGKSEIIGGGGGEGGQVKLG